MPTFSMVFCNLVQEILYRPLQNSYIFFFATLRDPQIFAPVVGHNQGTIFNYKTMFIIIWRQAEIFSFIIVTRNGKIVWKHVAVLIEISLLCWNFSSGPKHRRSLEKNMTFSEGNQLFAGDFHALLDEINYRILSDLVRRMSNSIF